MRPASILLAMLLIGLRTALAAEVAATPPAGTRVLETVVVSGELPGPGLWKVSRNDHVMWVLGALTPTPRRMVWRSEAVESVIAASDAVVLHPTASLRLGKGGVFGGLFLLPSLMGARKSADERELHEVLPAELYARWTILRDRYLGRAKGVEKRRPIFAAYALYEKATEKSGLSHGPFVGKVVRKAAKLMGRLAMEGQFNFIKSIWKFNKVYNADRQFADHQQPVVYQIRPPAPHAPLSKERSELYIHPKPKRAGAVEAAAAAPAE